MDTYRKLISLREDYDINSPKWNEVNDLATAYLRAQILAGHMEYANMIICDLVDVFTEGAYFDSPEFKAEYDGYINWFNDWGFEEYARELEDRIGE